MNPRQRMSLLVAVMMALLVAIAAWSYGQWSGARDRARRAADDSRAVAALAEAIESLRRQPTMGVQELGDTQINALLAQAMRSAGLDPQRAMPIIRHQPERRIANTPYRQKATDLRLQGVTLRQFTQFLHTLADANPGLRIESLQLSSPQGQGQATTWTVDPLSLSYLLYAPDGREARRADAAR